MTSRERVLASFSHQEPDRVPVWCGMSAEFKTKANQELGLDDEGLRVRLHDDFRRVYSEYRGPAVPLKHPQATCRTPFGVERSGLGYGQPIEHPLAGATRSDLEKYPWPDPAWVEAGEVKAQARAYRGQYAILGGEWSPFWHDAIDLLGMENLYMRMYDEPEFVDALMGHLMDYYFTGSRRVFDAGADAIDIFFMGNDFGSQNGPLMSPEVFARFILPHQKRLIQLGHDYGLKTQLHCCGGIAPLIPLLIEAGLDGLHAVQPTCGGMDLARLKAAFGARIVFNGGIDSHHILIEGTVDLVRRKTRETLRIMAAGGGYVAGASHDSILEETPVENIVAMCDAVTEWR